MAFAVWAARRCRLQLLQRWSLERRFSLSVYHVRNNPPIRRRSPVTAAEITSFLQNFHEYDGESDDHAAAGLVNLCVRLDTQPQALQVLKDWVSEGNALSTYIASSMCAWLIHRRDNVQALKIMKGMREEKMVEMTPKQYKREITVTCSHLGSCKGETLFQAVPADMKTEEVMTALVCGLAKESSVPKVENWLGQLPLTTLEPWNAVLTMYLKRDKHDDVRRTYYRLRRLGLRPTVYTYLVALQCRDRVGGFDEVDMEAEAALNQVSVEEADNLLLNTMMKCYALLGKRSMVEKIWEVFKSGSRIPDQNCYLAAIKSFGVFGDLLTARELVQELVSKYEVVQENPYISIVEIYVKLKMMDKAERVLKKYFEKPCFAPYNFLITGYLERSDSRKALQKLDEGFAAVPYKDIRLSHRTVMSLLPVFAARRDIQAAEKIIQNYSAHGDIAVYNELLKVYVATEMMPHKFVERIKEHSLEPDEVTEELMDRLTRIWNPNKKPYHHRPYWAVRAGRVTKSPYKFTRA